MGDLPPKMIEPEPFLAIGQGHTRQMPSRSNRTLSWVRTPQTERRCAGPSAFRRILPASVPGVPERWPALWENAPLLTPARRQFAAMLVVPYLWRARHSSAAAGIFSRGSPPRDRIRCSSLYTDRSVLLYHWRVILSSAMRLGLRPPCRLWNPSVDSATTAVSEPLPEQKGPVTGLTSIHRSLQRLYDGHGRTERESQVYSFSRKKVVTLSGVVEGVPSTLSCSVTTGPEKPEFLRFSLPPGNPRPAGRNLSSSAGPEGQTLARPPVR